MQPKILAATQSRVECKLHAHHQLRLIGAAGRRVQCVEGMVWITAYNQGADIFLKPGDVYVIPNGGLVLAEAIGSCRIQVDLPRSFDYSQCGMRATVGAARVLRQLQLVLARFKPASHGVRQDRKVA